MQRRSRSAMVQAIPLLVAVAIVGYLIGGSRSSNAPPKVSTTLVVRTATASNPVVLEYPSVAGWRVASGAPRVPGLAVAQPLVLAPGGEAGSAGLIAGRTSGAGSSPLPARFLADLHEVPRAEVVSLLNTQAYRYPRLTPIGFGYKLTLYAIPGTTGATTTIACYAASSPAASSYLTACEQLVGKLTLQLEAQSEILLTPDAGYARQIGEVIRRVDTLRVALRPAMGSRATPATLSRLAVRLADGLAGASQSVSALQPPQPAGVAQATLLRTLSRARAAYLALGGAAHPGNPGGYEAARTRVYEAEAQLVSALKGYALLAYE